MDDAARAVLSKKELIADNLEVSDRILNDLESDKVLTEDMSHEILAQPTPLRKVSKLLFLLRRRGCQAFPFFMKALRKNQVEFLADKLEEEYRIEQQKAKEPSSHSKRASPRRADRQACDVATSPINFLPPIDRNAQTSSATHCREHSNTNQSQSSSKSVSQSDHSIQSWTPSQHLEGQLVELHSRLKSHLVNRNVRELSFTSPEQVGYCEVKDLVVELIENVEECYRILNVDNKASLVTHCIQLKESKRKLKKDLKTKDESWKTVNEKYISLKNSYRNIKDNLDKTKRQIDTLISEKKCLTENLKESNAAFETNQANFKEKEQLADNLSEKLDLKHEENGKLLENKAELLNINNEQKEKLMKMEKENEALKKQVECLKHSGKPFYQWNNRNKAMPLARNLKSSMVINKEEDQTRHDSTVNDTINTTTAGKRQGMTRHTRQYRKPFHGQEWQDRSNLTIVAKKAGSTPRGNGTQM